MNLLAEIKSRFATALATVCDNPNDYIDMIRASQDPKFGDFQANCAMPLGKKLGQAPRDVAQTIVQNLDVAELCDPPEVAGPGFINLRIRDDWITQAVNDMVHDERFSVQPVQTPRNIVVDFSSPNVAKPMHVGHLRSTVIGDAICRILRFLGHNVTSDNHIGDWGTQFGMIIYGYRHFLNEAELAENPVQELARLYKLVSQLQTYHKTVKRLPELKVKQAAAETQLAELEATGDPKDKATKKSLKKLRSQIKNGAEAIKDAEQKITAVESSPALKSLADGDAQIEEHARQETAKLHAGDAENLALWNRFLPDCLQMLQVVYDRMDIHFDVTLGESFYQPKLAAIVKDLKAQGFAKDSDGAVCIFVEGNAAPFMIQKSDGAFTYATTDLATIRHRLDELQADEMLYVVDARQGEHFKLLFQTAELCGWDQAKMQHVSFGTVLGDDGKPLKTRSGDNISLTDLLDESVSRARRIVNENDDRKSGGAELDDETRQEIATIVGMGGVKYADLKHNRESDYKFNWDKMLATNGDTATYMQYAYARTRGIFRRGGLDAAVVRTESGTINPQHQDERQLALQLVRFEEALHSVADDYRPNLLTAYLFQTAGCLSAFYDSCNVLKESDAAVKHSRLLMVDLAGRVIQKGLALLGIATADRM